MSKKILLVEDDEAISEIVELILIDSGYQVHCSPVAKGFSENVQTFSPDLILLDIRLPDGDGRDLCRDLKSNTVTQGIPVILMSAHASLSEITSEGCADAFIPKPFDIDFLVNEVGRHI